MSLLFAVIGLLILCSSFFSASETSLTAVGRVRIRQLADNGDKEAARLLPMLEEPNRFLATILVGNNVVNIAASALATALAIELLGAKGPLVAAVLMTIAVLTFGEIIPKAVAANNPQGVALRVAGAIRALMSILGPVVSIFTWISSLALRLTGARGGGGDLISGEDIQALVTMGREEGSIEAYEHDIIHNVFEFGETRVREIMVPRVDIVGVSQEAALNDVVDKFLEAHVSRIVVYGQDLDDVVGYIHVLDVLGDLSATPPRTAGDVKRDALFIPETLRIEKLLQRMREERAHFAVVMDEYGATAGLVTADMLVTEIVGAIGDEHESNDDMVQAIDPQVLEIDGRFPIEDLNSELGTDLPEDLVQTVGGYLFHRLGYIPKVNDAIEVGDLEFKVLSVEKRTIGKIRITKRS